MTRFCGESGLRLVLPPPQLCTELAQQEEVNAGILGNWSSALLREMRRQLLGRSPKITAGGSIAFASKLDQLVEFDCRQRQIGLLDGASHGDVRVQGCEIQWHMSKTPLAGAASKV